MFLKEMLLIALKILIDESLDSLDETVIDNTLKNSLFYIQSDAIQKELLFNIFILKLL